jgi:hypothetical protein
MTNSDGLDQLRKRIQHLAEVDGVVFGTRCGADHAGARPWRRPRILAVVGFMRSSPRPLVEGIGVPVMDPTAGSTCR